MYYFEKLLILAVVYIVFAFVVTFAASLQSTHAHLVRLLSLGPLLLFADGSIEPLIFG